MRLHNTARHTVLISPTDNKLTENLENSGITVEHTQCVSQLLQNEQYHADMQICIINNTAFVPEDCVSTAKTAVEYGYNTVLCKVLSQEYPSNVALNAALIGDKLFCKESALADEIKEYCKANGIKIINVNQGYTKCSTLILNENAIITADETIRKAAVENGIRVLKITAGFIHLDNINYGFIGGCSGRIGDTVYFFGDVNTHPDADIILEFIKAERLNYICLSDGLLNDIGGFVVLK